jgi:murein endopeptidase
VEFITKLGVAWNEQNPEGPRLLIGDLSIEGGGPTPKQWGNPARGYHKSHGSGLDFDVQVIRTDNEEKPRSVTVSHRLYDRARTQNLVNLIRQLAGAKFDLILSADEQLHGRNARVEPTHVYHLHVRLKK